MFPSVNLIIKSLFDHYEDHHMGTAVKGPSCIILKCAEYQKKPSCIILKYAEYQKRPSCKMHMSLHLPLYC